MRRLGLLRKGHEERRFEGGRTDWTDLADLDLHKRLAEAKTGRDKTVLQRQIDATDRQIDRLVYELYALTDEEMGIVEEGAK